LFPSGIVDFCVVLPNTSKVIVAGLLQKIHEFFFREKGLRRKC
jgi:hypothetical protein